MKDERDKRPYDIRQRAFEYSLEAIKLYQTLQEKKDGAAWVIAKQFLRSATSIGANIEEAQSAESKADFIHKYGIAQKEARESSYWLRLILVPFLKSNLVFLRPHPVPLLKGEGTKSLPLLGEG